MIEEHKTLHRQTLEEPPVYDTALVQLVAYKGKLGLRGGQQVIVRVRCTVVQKEESFMI